MPWIYEDEEDGNVNRRITLTCSYYPFSHVRSKVVTDVKAQSARFKISQNVSSIEAIEFRIVPYMLTISGCFAEYVQSIVIGVAPVPHHTIV
jgi:hypothetical protein